MPNKEQGPLSPERVEFVELNGVECWALAHGFEKNQGVIALLLEFMDSKTLEFAVDQLADSDRVGFARNKHNEDIETAYEQVAAAELKRLVGKAEEDWKCGHTVGEHQEALESAAAKLKKPAN